MNLKPSEVAIVGAGPAGSAAAILLARRGWSVRLLDKARFPREKLCGEFLSPDGVAALERLGLTDAVRAAGAAPVTGTLVSAPSGRSVASSFDRLPGLPSEGLALSRRVLDALLLAEARRAGADVIEGAAAESPVVEQGRASGVRIRRAPDAAPEILPAAWILAADGRHTRFSVGGTSRSRPPSHDRTPLIGAGRPLPHLTCAFRARFHGIPPLEGRVELHAFAGGYAGLVRAESGLTNLCFLIDGEAARAARGDVDALARDRLARNPLLAGRLAGAERAGEWLATGPLDFTAREPAADGILLLGDAAGIIDPFCGDGMAMALRSAELAVEALEGGRVTGWESGRVSAAYGTAWERSFARRRRAGAALRAALMRPWLAETAVAALRPLPGGLRYLVRATRS